MALTDSLREMFAMIELEMRRLKHDRTEIYTRAVQPILWLAVYGTVMSHVRDIPTGGIPYIDYITPGVLSSVHDLRFSLLRPHHRLGEGDWNSKALTGGSGLKICHSYGPGHCIWRSSHCSSPYNLSCSDPARREVHLKSALYPRSILDVIHDLWRLRSSVHLCGLSHEDQRALHGNRTGDDHATLLRQQCAIPYLTDASIPAIHSIRQSLDLCSGCSERFDDQWTCDECLRGLHCRDGL